MPTNVKVIRATDFIRARPTGDVNLALGLRLLREIADAGTGLENYQVLVDTRHVEGSLTPAELWTLAGELAAYRRSTGSRTAVLCPSERFDNARFFALCAENRGVNVQAFTAYEPAMEWLLLGEQ